MTIDILSTPVKAETNNDDIFTTETGSPLFKKVNIRGCLNKREGEEPKEVASDSAGENKLSFPKCSRDKRKVSFSDELQEEEEGGEGEQGVESRGGVGLRRLLYRHRQTISKMLHDGENHEVWRPGMRRTRRLDSQVWV